MDTKFQEIAIIKLKHLRDKVKDREKYQISDEQLLDNWKEHLYEEMKENHLRIARSLERCTIYEIDNQVDMETIIFPIIQRIVNHTNEEITDVKRLKNDIKTCISIFQEEYDGQFFYDYKLDGEACFCAWFCDSYTTYLDDFRINK